MKRAHTLVTLVGQAIKPEILADLDNSGRESLNSLVSCLINLATMEEGAPALKLSGLAAAAGSTLGKILNAMPAVTFVESCVSMLASDSTIVCYFRIFILLFWLTSPTLLQIHIGALELLSERIPNVADHIRRDITRKINHIVELVIKLLAQDNVRLRAQSLRVLAAVGSTLVPGEQGPLTTSLPLILGALSVPDLVGHALDTLIPLS